jgi:signal transduction histidine kinase
MVQSLQEAREKLVAKEKFSTIGRISGAIAHDVRHPLATIKNSAYFLNMTLKDPNDKTKKHLNLINSEVVRANDIITGLMRLSEIKKPEKIITNVTDLLNEFLTSFNLPDKIKLITEFDSTCPDILIDQLQIKQVFANLASNAVRAMSEEGTLTVKTLRVKCSGDKGDLVEVLFNDTGCGIKKDILAKIFEAFYTTRSSGMGLGLSIVKDIVNANGGEIIVESEEGKGSIFKITFPGVLTG